MVEAKLHNFVIENDSIDFETAQSLEDFGVEPLLDGPNNNSRFLPSDPLEDVHRSNTIGVSSYELRLWVRFDVEI